MYRPKHPTKVQVWPGISKQGSTGICIFDGIMDRHLYMEILVKTLVPFIRDVYPDSHWLMADNDLKHTSKDALMFLEENDVHWWRTPAESPDLRESLAEAQGMLPTKIHTVIEVPIFAVGVHTP